eukprot:286908_1
MSTAFMHWSVDDVKRWVVTWHSEYSVTKSTVSNVIKAADLYHINGKTLTHFTKDDLRQFGLNNQDIKIIIQRIDSLVIGSYLDYMMLRYNRYLKRNIPPLIPNINYKESHDHQTKENIHVPKRKKKTATNRQYNAKVNTHSKTTDELTRNNTYHTDNKEAIQSIGSNRQVRSATRSAMSDNRIRSAAWNTYRGGGNDIHSNKQLVGALAQNKAVRAATVSVAKDKKVQKAAYQTAKKNATKKNMGKISNMLNFNV